VLTAGFCLSLAFPSFLYNFLGVFNSGSDDSFFLSSFLGFNF
jgi:hypothetical protein